MIRNTRFESRYVRARWVKKTASENTAWPTQSTMGKRCLVNVVSSISNHGLV
jgi:hypothetical protein